MRVTSEIYVSALRRRAESAGAFVTVVDKGAQAAGAIYVIVRKDTESWSLFGPAPQSLFDGVPTDRAFEALLQDVLEEEIKKRLESEKRFDPDIWIIEIEDPKGRSFVDLPED